MDAKEKELRERVAAIAREWLGTPYHHAARVKGQQGGVDCATLLCEVYREAGMVGSVDIDFYPPDWHMHRDIERYVTKLSEYACEVPLDNPQPGDVLVVKFGRAFSHGAIVVAWPLCVHAVLRQDVQYVDANRDVVFQHNSGELRERKLFSLWGERK